MFDPTVFDNLKVIVEGYIYDLDLEKEISVINRSDMIDLARMSRSYLITFSNIEKSPSSVTFEIEMKHKQLSGELQQKILNPVCHIKLTLQEEINGKEYDELLLRKLKKLWGDEHLIKLFVTKEITSPIKNYQHQYQICFNTTYGEDDIEALLHIVDQSISLLRTMTR